MAIREDLDLLPIVAKMKAQGYAPVHWTAHQKGIRVKQSTGKIAIPSQFTKNRICMTHGNLVKVRHETHPGLQRGILILDVLPCLWCSEDPIRQIMGSPKTDMRVQEAS